MRKFSVFLLALPLILFTSGMAGAYTLNDVEGAWSNPVGGVDVNLVPASQPDDDVSILGGSSYPRRSKRIGICRQRTAVF
jgi:hypothetical protein